MRAVDVTKPSWSSSSFLLYAGGFAVLAAAGWGLQVTESGYGDAAFVGWSALVLVVLELIAFAFRSRGEWIAAGTFIFAAVIAWGIFVGAVFSWWGWLADQDNAFDGFHVGNLLLALLVLADARVARWLFRFPLLVAIEASVAWYFVTDLISNGGGWSAIVTFVVGIVYLIVGSTVDRGPRRPYGFWWQLASGALIGGALLYFWHSSTGDWILIAIAGLVYVGLGARLGRSTWTVFGALGLFAAAVYFTRKWTGLDISLFTEGPQHIRDWVPPVVLAVLGFLYVALGLLVERRGVEAA
jgi:hypothetical protein